MATDKIDMSLDDIIKKTKIGRDIRGRRGARGNLRGNRGGKGKRGASATVTATSRGRGNFRSARSGRGFGGASRAARTGTRGRFGGVLRGGIQKRRQQPVYTQRQVEGIWQHDMFEGGALNRQRTSAEGKLLISNLDYAVNDADIKELYAEFGQLLKAAVHYDFSGRSLGTAEVVFSTQAEALKALKQYNTVPLDGRPMKIQLVSDNISQLSAGARRGNARGSVRGAARGQSGFGNRLGGAATNKFATTYNQNRRGAGSGQGQRRGVGGSGRGRGRGGRSRAGPAPTREQLDAQLDEYNKMDLN